ncbi:hypothetical protein SAMN06265222_11633 [Neorhodopirellula lusitana]|uniref:VOC domain-containing protein n=1 Tax=Neorhodopirellula lusitana TaxID=445327 RepID=A0ABY1QJZ2_9BACT|nr:hypothetical protein [Neorhodopirellula lusitana]SMP73145.1 hypothetical protein SAMN06265222_11633 [Neorhodopirellula lusitana]
MMSDGNPRPAMRDFKPFLGYGTDDFEAAKLFYQDVGFENIWDGCNACCFNTGIGNRFLVTLHIGYDRSSAGMLHLWVESVDSWYDYLAQKQLDTKYPGVKIADPSVAEWGWRILYVWDPGGWLLHIAEPHSEENKAFFNSAPWLELKK